MGDRLTAIIIQARMGSTRLPGKVAANIAGYPMLAHVVQRCRRVHGADQVAVATSTVASDDAVAALCASLDAPCWRGSLDDVLDRYYSAARALRASTVVRVTADCPLLDPAVVEATLTLFARGDVDYASNTLERSYPDGLDCEVFSFDALERAWREARWQSEREHVTPYFYKHPEQFRIAQLVQQPDYSRMRWTVDDASDLAMVRRVFAQLEPGAFAMADVLRILQQDPAISAMNGATPTNQGYQESLDHDTLVTDPTP